MKRALKYLLYSCLALIGVVAGYFVVAHILTVIPTNSDYQPPTDGIAIFLQSNGTHVDLTLPVRNAAFDWHEVLAFTDFKSAASNVQYIAFGWGEREFYASTPTWDDLTVSTAAYALLLPSESAMHVTVLENEPALRPSCRRLQITAESYRKLCDFVKAGFAMNNGQPTPLDIPGYGSSDRFYAGAGDYHAINTCNDWTNRGLKEAGVKTAMWAPLEYSVMYHAPEPTTAQ